MTVKLLEAIREIADSDPSALRRFAALGSIALTLDHSLTFSPDDTLSEWTPRVSSHVLADKNQPHGARAAEMLLSLSKEAKYRDIKRRAADLVRWFGLGKKP